MGQRGPIADPNRRLRGRPERRTTASEPVEFPPISTDPPVNLLGPARRRWDLAVAALPAVGVRLFATDAATLARWAVLADRLDTLNMAIDRTCAAGGDVSGLVKVWLRLSGVADAMDRQFGMTPTARRRLGAKPPTTADDELESFRSRGRNTI